MVTLVREPLAEVLDRVLVLRPDRVSLVNTHGGPQLVCETASDGKFPLVSVIPVAREDAEAIVFGIEARMGLSVHRLGCGHAR